MNIARIYLFILTFLFLGCTNLHHYSRDLASIDNIQSKDFQVIDGGIVDIPDGAYIEGSIDQGGIQPHYKIDYSSPVFNDLKKFAHEIRDNQELNSLDKIKKIQNFVRNKVLLYRRYDEPKYLNLLEKYRNSKSNIPLSEYRVCESGVCREHALIYHMALKEAGFDSYHAYVEVYYGKEVEDHAVNVVMLEGEEWVFDSYSPYFNGFKLQDLLNGISVKDSITGEGPIFMIRGINKIHTFPKYYLPKSEKVEKLDFQKIKFKKKLFNCIGLFKGFIINQ